MGSHVERMLQAKYVIMPDGVASLHQPWMLPPKDPLDRFHVSRQYKEHLESVASDRQLEMYLQADCW